MPRRKTLSLTLLALLLAAVIGGWLARRQRPAASATPEQMQLAALFDQALTNFQQRTAMTAAIAARGERAVPFLGWQAGRGLGLLDQRYREQWPKLPMVLKQTLPKPAYHVKERALAVELLGRIGPAAHEALPDLLAALEHATKEPGVKSHLVRVLPADVWKVEIRPDLLMLARAIGSIGSDDKQTILRLLEISKLSQVPFAHSATDRPFYSPGQPIKLPATTPPNLAPAIRHAIPELMRHARSTDPLLREEALLYLGSLVRDPEMDFTKEFPLLALIASVDGHPNHAGAVSALGKLDDNQGVVLSALIDALNGNEVSQGVFYPGSLSYTRAPDPHRYAVNAFSLSAAGTLASRSRLDARVIPALESALQHTNARVRAGACHALEGVGKPAQSLAPKLASLGINDPSIAVRYHAAMAVFKLDGNPRPLLPFKVAELKSVASVIRIEGIEFLSLHGRGDTAASEALLRTAFHDEDMQVREMAVAALRRLEVPPAAVNDITRTQMKELINDARAKADKFRQFLNEATQP